MLVAAVGNAIATATTNVGARFFAMFMMPMGAVSACKKKASSLQSRNFTLTAKPTDQIIVSWVANSFPRPMVKRSASIAIANMVGNTASIYGSYMYPKSASPRYIPGGSANTAICVLVAATAFVLRLVHVRENKKLAAAELEDVASDANKGTTDPTGKPSGFRYIV